MLRLLLTYAYVCGGMRDTTSVFPAERAESSAGAVVVAVDDDDDDAAAAAAAAAAAQLPLHVHRTHPV